MGGLPSPELGLSGIGQDPAVLLGLFHGHLLVPAVGLAHYVHSLLAHHKVAVLAPPLQTSFDFESIGKLDQRAIGGFQELVRRIIDDTVDTQLGSGRGREP